MQGPEKYVPCLYCQRGPRGTDPDPCSGVQHVRTLKGGGCFEGKVAPGMERRHQRFVREQKKASA